MEFVCLFLNCPSLPQFSNRSAVEAMSAQPRFNPPPFRLFSPVAI